MSKLTYSETCDHNGFAHRVFPFVALSEGEPILDGLTQDGETRRELLTAVFKLVDTGFPRGTDRPQLFMKDIVVSEELVAQRRLVILSLTPASEPIGVYFIGLLVNAALHSDQSTPLRYFTFEYQGGSDASAVLCEWASLGSENLSHRNLGLCGPPSKDSFVKLLTRFLKREHSLPSHTPD